MKKICASCQEPVAYFDAVYGLCGHDYCKHCVKQLFFMATRDESLFPPRCCRKAIPLAAASVFFTEEFITHFKAKAVEWSTPNRTYCAWVTCAAFIPPGNLNHEIGVCPNCGFWTCTFCKNHSHGARDCPQNIALQGLIAVAQAAKWQRCYRCNRFVELLHGCNHMTYAIPLLQARYCSPLSDHFLDATAVQNSAISALALGNPGIANAPFGTRVV